MAQSKTRHAANVTGCDNSYGELQPNNYQKSPFDASDYAALWIEDHFVEVNKMIELGKGATRIIAALACLGGGA